MCVHTPVYYDVSLCRLWFWNSLACLKTNSDILWASYLDISTGFRVFLMNFVRRVEKNTRQPCVQYVHSAQSVSFCSLETPYAKNSSSIKTHFRKDRKRTHHISVLSVSLHYFRIGHFRQKNIQRDDSLFFLFISNEYTRIKRKWTLDLSSKHKERETMLMLSNLQPNDRRQLNCWIIVYENGHCQAKKWNKWPFYMLANMKTILSSVFPLF